MNLKLVLGIILPFVVIVGLVIMSSTNVGFSMEKNDVKEILYASIFSSNYQAGEIAIQTIKIKNDYFLDKRIDLPIVMVCLYDKENKITSENVNVRYNTGKATDIAPDPITGIVTEASMAGRYYSYGYSTAERNVNVPAHKTKDVKLMVQPRYSYNYYYNGYDGGYDNTQFDELLILEPDDDNEQDYKVFYSYNSCQNLDDEDIADAIHIPINKDNIPSISCETISDYYNKDKCFSNQAIKTLNSSMCRKITQVYDRDNCFSNLATTLKDASLCNEIVQSGRDQCLYNLAFALKDKSLCGRIVDASWKNSCNSI